MMGHRRHTTSVAAAMASAAVILAGCSIPTDSGPRDIPEDERRDIEPPREAPSVVAAGETRIFLVAEADDGDQSVLRSVARDVEGAPASVLDALLRGRTEEEQDEGLLTLLPDDLTLTPVPHFPSSELIVEANSALNELPGDTRALAVGQIVTTLTALDGVTNVSIQLEDESEETDDDPPQWPTGNSELVTRPLTVYDFMVLLDTAQPAYPPIPSEPSDAGRTTTTSTAAPSSGSDGRPEPN